MCDVMMIVNKINKDKCKTKQIKKDENRVHNCGVNKLKCDNVAFGRINVELDYLVDAESNHQNNGCEHCCCCKQHQKDAQQNKGLLDENISNKNIRYVERIGSGRYKVYFKEGTFTNNCKVTNLAPIIMLTPCESNVLDQTVNTDAQGNPIIASELFPTEQAVVLCNYVDGDCAIIITGRTLTGSGSPEEPVDGPVGSFPLVTNDVSFEIYARQAA